LYAKPITDGMVLLHQIALKLRFSISRTTNNLYDFLQWFTLKPGGSLLVHDFGPGKIHYKEAGAGFELLMATWPVGDRFSVGELFVKLAFAEWLLMALIANHDCVAGWTVDKFKNGALSALLPLATYVAP
jgi:hypothetical protein